MYDEPNDSDLVETKKKPASEQIFKFYEVYSYHVLLIVLGIVVVGAPIVYSTKIGRSGILSGVFNYDIKNFSGYCYPFTKPTFGEGYTDNVSGEGIDSVPESDDKNLIITDDISFYVSLQKCIKDTFKGTSSSTASTDATASPDTTASPNPTDTTGSPNPTGSPDTTASTSSIGGSPTGSDQSNDVCSVSYGKLIEFNYDSVKTLLTPSLSGLKYITQIQNLIQYLKLNSIITLSDEFATIYQGKATFFSYFFSIAYLIFVNLPLDIIRRSFVLAVILYDVVFGIIFNFLLIVIPSSLLENILLFLPPLLLLALPLTVFFNLFVKAFDLMSWVFVAFFIIYYLWVVAEYALFIFFSYSKAADNTDIAFFYMKIFIYLGGIIALVVLMIYFPAFFVTFALFIKQFSKIVMYYIAIAPLFFRATIVNREGDSEGDKKYSFLNYLLGILIYKRSFILFLLLLIFIYDLFLCKVISLSSSSMGTVFIFLIILLIFGYFNNTLIFDEAKKNSYLSSYAINYFTEKGLKKNGLIELTKEDYKQFSKRSTRKCNATFGETTVLLPMFDYPGYSVIDTTLSFI